MFAALKLICHQLVSCCIRLLFNFILILWFTCFFIIIPLCLYLYFSTYCDTVIPMLLSSPFPSLFPSSLPFLSLLLSLLSLLFTYSISHLSWRAGIACRLVTRINPSSQSRMTSWPLPTRQSKSTPTSSHSATPNTLSCQSIPVGTPPRLGLSVSREQRTTSQLANLMERWVTLSSAMHFIYSSSSLMSTEHRKTLK